MIQYFQEHFVDVLVKQIIKGLHTVTENRFKKD